MLPPMSLAPGSALGPYTITAELGHGGMGVVYTAQDPRLKRQVAIKLLPPDLTRDETAKARFLQEAQAASALDHPNICTIHEINETDDGQLYLVMAHYEGETLKERIERGPLELDEALDIATQVGKGLAEAHAAGIVHRDIKPANLLIAKGDTVKILDFGLAKLAGTDDVTQTATALGTVAYMSPEQARGQAVDHRTDIWSLGAVLYEMLSGRRPFHSDNLLGVAEAIRTQNPSPLIGSASRFDAAVGRALHKDPTARHQTITDLLADLVNEPQLATPNREREIPSIAVLPFADLSPNGDQEYFCDGLAEELIDTLARLDGIRVVARTSAFQFRGKGHDLREVGAALRVKTVLEGSVRKAGARLRINAQLIDVKDGSHLWSERYDRDLDDVFVLQDEIARSVVDRLRVKLLGDATGPLVTRPTDSLEAYACYMQGRHHRFTRYNMQRAVRCFEEAVRHDPGYAAAWAGIADSALAAGAFLLLPPAHAAEQARSAVERALALDDGLAEAHGAQGRIRCWYDWDWAGAARSFQRAIALNPSSVDVYATYAAHLGRVGRLHEAQTQIAKAHDVDPLSAHTSHQAGYAFLVNRRFDAAIAAFQEALDLEPDSSIAPWFLCLSLQAQGRHHDILTQLRQASPAAARQPFHLGLCGMALGLTGAADEAEAVCTELEARARDEYVSSFALALIAAGLGEHDRCLDHLDRAHAERSPALVYLQMPVFDPIRSHPRFQTVFVDVGLPDLSATAASSE